VAFIPPPADLFDNQLSRTIPELANEVYKYHLGDFPRHRSLLRRHFYLTQRAIGRISALWQQTGPLRPSIVFRRMLKYVASSVVSM